jgi:intracellular septation protein
MDEANYGNSMTKPIFERDPSDPEREKINPVLKLALELGPLLVFFLGNSRGEWLAERFPALGEFGGPIFIATALFMAATVIALVISWALTRTLPIMPLVSGVVVVVFGALTLWLQDELFIKLKPTIINTMFGFCCSAACLSSASRCCATSSIVPSGSTRTAGTS